MDWRCANLHLHLRALMVQPVHRWPQEDGACYTGTLGDHFFEQEQQKKSDKEQRRDPGAVRHLVRFDKQFLGHEIE